MTISSVQEIGLDGSPDKKEEEGDCWQNEKLLRIHQKVKKF
jgi:hypothetical protein